MTELNKNADVFSGLKKAALKKKENNLATISFSKMIKKVYGNIMVQEDNESNKNKRKPSKSPLQSQKDLNWTPPEFDELKPYTTTVMVRLDSEIDVHALYKTLPVLPKDHEYATKNGAIVGKRYLSKPDAQKKDKGSDKDSDKENSSKDGSTRKGNRKNKNKNKKDKISKEKEYLSDNEAVDDDQLPCFPHQVTIRMVTALNTPTIRVFPTNIAIVGCKDTSTIEFVCDAIKEYILEIEKRRKISVFIGDPYEEVTYTINMCNYNFSLGFLVDRQELYRRVETMKGDFIALFNPTFYSGVMLKHKCKKSDKDNTIIVFVTGSVIFSCKHDQQEAREIYNKFSSIIVKLRNKIELKPKTRAKRRVKSKGPLVVNQ